MRSRIVYHTAVLLALLVAIACASSSTRLLQSASIAIGAASTPSLAISTPTSHAIPAATPTRKMSSRLLGLSTNGFPMRVYTIGNGSRRIALIGGMHGGFEWNTILLAWQMVDHFSANPHLVPADVTLLIVPSANPDGQVLVTSTYGRFTADRVVGDTARGRFNGRGVDLNRNWDCEWQAEAFWRQRVVSGGSAPFSERETKLLRTFLTQPPMDAVIFWHSTANAIFAGGCGDRFAAADALGQRYAQASGYPFQLAFTSYPITGDATNWLALQEIPAIVVELRTSDNTEWEQNLAGVMAVLEESVTPTDHRLP